MFSSLFCGRILGSLSIKDSASFVLSIGSVLLLSSIFLSDIFLSVNTSFSISSKLFEETFSGGLLCGPLTVVNVNIS